jgi:hypothetical protein
MKPATLEAALKNHLNLRAEINELEELKTRSEKELAGLEVSCDLQDQAALTKIAGLQVLIRLLPARIAARENQRESVRASLVGAGEAFIAETLRPKLSSLRATAMEKVKKSVAAIYSDKHTLAEVIAQSDLVQSVETISGNITIQNNPQDCVGYINNILRVLKRAEEIEKTL